MVLLEVSINARGEPTAIKVKASSRFTILDEAAVEAVKQWRFEPARVNGRPQICAVEVPIRFSLSR
jgi:protein TonB